MNAKMIGLLAFQLLCTTGCAIKNHAYGTAAPAASLPADGKSTVFLTRPGVVGFAVKYGVTINGEERAPLSATRFVEAKVDPGLVEVKAKGEKTCTVTFEAEPDMAYYLKATNKMGWLFARVQLDAIDPAEGSAFVSSATTTDASASNAP